VKTSSNCLWFEDDFMAQAVAPCAANSNYAVIPAKCTQMSVFWQVILTLYFFQQLAIWLGLAVLEQRLSRYDSSGIEARECIGDQS
jgi:hypothetical protein